MKVKECCKMVEIFDLGAAKPKYCNSILICSSKLFQSTIGRYSNQLQSLTSGCSVRAADSDDYLTVKRGGVG